ncbi:NEL-type E3 ubiquitin ligase domain-containing protein [Pseudomonas sp. Sample_22]|uniref:NEL-type E3 ubiquitin ligase domain-containing protein n=1 Tax=Pseudomonas sp. Sample_22 TaxID=2448266 RepID=UPI001032BBBE|nr:NEL-type E3 ubiquitin ligase domain-containing protein [Pseudomonas sp. Sample_22]
MDELQNINEVSSSSLSPAQNNGVHYERIVQVLPPAIKTAPPARVSRLASTTVSTPGWYLKASAVDRQYLKELIDKRWLLQRLVEAPLQDLQQDIRAFAKPLLSQLMSSNFNSHDDVGQLTLKLYVPDKIIFGIDRGASHMRESTLLDAALHNFEEPETAADYFRSGSGVYRSDLRGEPSLIPSMSVSKIARLCRRLDVGAQYQNHLKSLLLPADTQQRQVLEQRGAASEKAAFELASLIALLKDDISSYAYGVLRDVRDNKSAISFHHRPLHRHRLSLMGFSLHGVVLFSAEGDGGKIQAAVEALAPDERAAWLNLSSMLSVVLPGNDIDKFKLLQAFFANGPTGVSEEMLRQRDIYKQNRLSGPVIAYVPDDPVHPLKEYASLTDFMKVLISQLREPDYQAFFSRFVAQKDKGRFFARVRERLSRITWQQREPLDMGPWWRETAVENPNAEPVTHRLSGELWAQLYRLKRDKAISDARVIAVPTGDEDATTRWKRLTSYLDIGWNLFNFAAMLVPGLGEAMLALMVAQIGEELLEGIEDWSKGDRDEASTHINSVLINFAQLALMATGHVLPSGARVAVTPSPMIDSLKPVELPDGKTRLWKPDLAPYEQSAMLPAEARPNDLGIYQYNDQQWLRLEKKHYRVRQDPVTGEHRLQHPTRPSAYQPRVEHNNAGAWKAETEHPLRWDATQLMSRLDNSLDNYSASTLAKIQQVSGVEEGLLRRLHVEHETPPALLRDTLTRFNTYADAQRYPEQILSDQVSEEMSGFLPATLVELPRWPESRALEVFERDDRTGASVKHGNTLAAEPQTLKISRSELVAGKLPERVIESLDTAELREMLGAKVANDTSSRIDALRSRLAMQARKQQKRLFDALYKSRDVSGSAQVRLLVDDFAQLPASVAQELLESAEPADLQHLTEKRRLPLRLRRQARLAQEHVRLNRAYEGLYLDELVSADTRRLELATLASLPGWSTQVRIEIRHLGFSGDLLASVGPAQAPIRKVLVLDEDGLYQARDANDHHLHGTDDLYASVLHALPDNERNALGYDIHENARLKEAVRRSPLSHEQFEPILLEQPIRKPLYDLQAMRLPGGMLGYLRELVGGRAEQSPQARIRRLYPAFTEQESTALLERFNRQGILVDLQLEALELEFERLSSTLKRWVNSPTRDFRFSPSGFDERNARSQFARKIRQCWQRTGPKQFDSFGNVIGEKLDLSSFPLNLHFKNMPALEGNFDHVTYLKMFNCGVTDAQQSFLQPFRKLRALDLGNNRLTALPRHIAQMPHLNFLELSGNRIVLMASDVDVLGRCTKLQTLGLAGNPLGLLPNISRMPDLHTLLLYDTGATTWPAGLFDLPRPRHIHLDLQRNVLTHIPEVTPGSVDAELLARTLLSRQPPFMSAENLERLKEYIRSTGLDPDRPYPPRGVRDTLQWQQGITFDQWVQNQMLWDALEDEFNSHGFFDEIRRLTQSADFTAGGAYRTDLTAKVWRMIETMARDAELRTKFFSEASMRTQCVDGATQLFNVLGVDVLVQEALELGNASLIETQLVELARGKSRLDEIERIARRHIIDREAAGERFRRIDEEGNVTGTIDEVEVHLAFMTDLAERLNLPWQARGMQFRQIAGVTSEMIEDAYQRVLGLEEGDLLRDSIAEQPFWRTYVQRSNRARFRVFDRKTEATTEFKVALDDRAAGSDLTLKEREKLKEDIRVLAAELGKPESAFEPGKVVTDEVFAAELDLIRDERETLLKQLTQQAMDRAKLRRVEPPAFTLETTD